MIEFAALQRMMPERVDKLPMPAEFRAHNSAGRRLRWVGFAWCDEGAATGTEPLLVIDSRDARPKRRARGAARKECAA